jgi:hypothetical protein
MKIIHSCDRNIPDVGDLEIYSYDRGPDKKWYINARIIFYCPYCGIDMKKVEG